MIQNSVLVIFRAGGNDGKRIVFQYLYFIKQSWFVFTICSKQHVLVQFHQVIFLIFQLNVVTTWLRTIRTTRTSPRSSSCLSRIPILNGGSWKITRNTRMSFISFLDFQDYSLDFAILGVNRLLRLIWISWRLLGDVSFMGSKCILLR